jgi:hypothetical protein
MAIQFKSLIDNLLSPIRGLIGAGGGKSKAKPAGSGRPPMSDYIDDSVIEDDEDRALKSELGSKRPETLDLMDIPDHRDPPDDVLSPGDMSAIRFTTTRPEGYSKKQVAAYFRVVKKSIRWWYDTMATRDGEIAALGTQLDKMSTDLHNMKLNAEMAEGLSVVTGDDSSTEQELMQAQITIGNLNDQIAKLKRRAGSGEPGPGDSRFDSIQNELAMSQLENKKLRKSLESMRASLAAANEEALGVDGVPVGHVVDLPAPDVSTPLRAPVTDSVPPPDDDEGAVPIPRVTAMEPGALGHDDALTPPSFDDDTPSTVDATSTAPDVALPLPALPDDDDDGGALPSPPVDGGLGLPEPSLPVAGAGDVPPSDDDVDLIQPLPDGIGDDDMEDLDFGDGDDFTLE